jgi:hypothetical protein
MRFFESWWEHAPTILRVVPILLAVLNVLTQHPMDHFWD